MASAWGKSFGAAWGNAWGQIAADPPANVPSGGRARPLPHTWNVFYPLPHRRPRKRRQDDLLFLGR
jgi:hypothetical protein